MKAIALNEFGDADVLSLQELPEPLVGPDSVLIKVRAAWRKLGRLQDPFRLPAEHHPALPAAHSRVGRHWCCFGGRPGGSRLRARRRSNGLRSQRLSAARYLCRTVVRTRAHSCAQATVVNLNDSGVARGWLLIVSCRFSAVLSGPRVPGGLAVLPGVPGAAPAPTAPGRPPFRVAGTGWLVRRVRAGRTAAASRPGMPLSRARSG